MTMRKKLIIAIVVLSLVLSVEVVGTLAWLSDTTETVSNVFTHGDVNIDLEETVDGTLTSAADKDVTNDKDFKMVPANKLDKDPKVTVMADSEACYLFIKVEESANLNDYIAYAIDTGDDASKAWKVLDADKYPGVYYREVADTDKNQEFEILAAGSYPQENPAYTWDNNQVLVKPEVTKEMMDAIDGIDANGSTDSDAAKAELANRPTLSFTAYAVQKANVDTAADAWEILFPTANN